MKKIKVDKAEPYRYGQLGSFGKAAGMLLKQYQFPYEYTTADKLTQADSDRCFQWDHGHARRCFTKHTGGGEIILESWLMTVSNEDIMKFIIDILKAAPEVLWTGYRILGTVNRSTGYPVWTLQLFAKHPDSDTEVYTGHNAPNIKDSYPVNEMRFSPR